MADDLRLPATCGRGLAPVELQLQLPDTTPARRQGISVRLWVGTASVGVALAQSKAPLHPSSGPLSQSPAWAKEIVLGVLKVGGADLSQS